MNVATTPGAPRETRYTKSAIKTSSDKKKEAGKFDVYCLNPYADAHFTRFSTGSLMRHVHLSVAPLPGCGILERPIARWKAQKRQDPPPFVGRLESRGAVSLQSATVQRPVAVNNGRGLHTARRSSCLIGLTKNFDRFCQMRRVLLIAYHFPPLFGSSGLQRTLRFAQYLPAFGWQPFVLTVTENALFATDPATLSDIPDTCNVIRVPSLDAQRHLSLFGRYPPWVAIPDRWASWSILGPRIAARACKVNHIDAIWSTYPIATAHRIGALTAERTGLPWIADFRDPMIDDGFPSAPAQRRSFEQIEARTVAGADRLVFVTRSASTKYQAKYPQVPQSKFVVIENGYDESVFGTLAAARPQGANKPFVLLHSGIVYPHERDPTALFDAIALLRDRGQTKPGDFVIRFRAAVHVDLLRDLAQTRNVSEWIDIAGPLGYRAALEEMMAADALVLMQGRVCNEQIPAKLYEYMRAGRPIIGLADPEGDTGSKMRSLGIPLVAALEDREAVATTLLEALQGLHSATASTVARDVVAKYSRRELTRALASTMDDVVSHASQRPSTSPSAAIAR